MELMLVHGSRIDTADYELAERLHREPPVFTEDHLNPGDSFFDPCCRVMPIESIKPSWLIVANETVFAIENATSPMKIDPLMLIQLTKGQRVTSRVKRFCDLCGFKTYNWPEWLLVIPHNLAPF